jgi:hypothetical protein
MKILEKTNIYKKKLNIYISITISIFSFIFITRMKSAASASKMSSELIETIIKGRLHPDAKNLLNETAPGLQERIAENPDEFGVLTMIASMLHQVQESKHNCNVAEKLGLPPGLDRAVSALCLEFYHCECGHFRGMYPQSGDAHNGIRALRGSKDMLLKEAINITTALARPCDCAKGTPSAENAAKWQQLLDELKGDPRERMRELRRAMHAARSRK